MGLITNFIFLTVGFMTATYYCQTSIPQSSPWLKIHDHGVKLFDSDVIVRQNGKIKIGGIIEMTDFKDKNNK